MRGKVAEEIADDESDASMTITPEYSPQEMVREQGARPEVAIGMDGVLEFESSDDTTSPDGELSWSMRPPYARDPVRTEPVNNFLAVVGRILDESGVRPGWDKQWKHSREK